jgi:hypothetical protein
MSAQNGVFRFGSPLRTRRNLSGSSWGFPRCGKRNRTAEADIGGREYVALAQCRARRGWRVGTAAAVLAGRIATDIAPNNGAPFPGAFLSVSDNQYTFG